jgi:hypothetical protein
MKVTRLVIFLFVVVGVIFILFVFPAAGVAVA